MAASIAALAVPSAAPAYPHPQSADSVQVSLVPAFKQCGTGGHASTGAHASPLAVPSCNPEPVSGAARLGPNGSGLVHFAIVPGDFLLGLTITDVQTPAGADYNPGGVALRLRTRQRITDSSNCDPADSGCGPDCFPSCPHDQPGTATDFDWGPNDIRCVARGDPATPPGSDCSLSTSANAQIPGAVVSGRQEVVQLFRPRVFDVAEALFAQEGLFAP